MFLYFSYEFLVILCQSLHVLLICHREHMLFWLAVMVGVVRVSYVTSWASFYRIPVAILIYRETFVQAEVGQTQFADLLACLGILSGICLENIWPKAP